MAEKGLGMGLGALFGDAALEKENDFDYLPITKIEPRKEQPRDVFAQEALDELADSIKEHGVLQPLTVRKIDNGYFQIIAGERRWRAARLAGLSEVPVRIIAASDKIATELAMVENLQREDLNAIEEARGYKRLMEDYGMTQEDVSQRIGKSRPVVANTLRLLALPESVQESVEKGELSVGHARAILSLESEETRILAAEKIMNSKLTVREAETLVKKMSQSGHVAKKKSSDMVSVYVREIERDLEAALGRKVKIVYGKKAGRLELEYYDQNDFEDLIKTLSSIKPKKEIPAE